MSIETIHLFPRLIVRLDFVEVTSDLSFFIFALCPLDDASSFFWYSKVRLRTYMKKISS